MAVLDYINRLRTAAQYMRDVPTPTLLKGDIRAAVDATDSWIDGKYSNFISALPHNFKNVATLQQKTIMFAYVASRRAGLLKTQEDGGSDGVW